MRWFLREQDLSLPRRHALQKMILSFDDGPTEGLTDKILDLLKEHQVRAIFFVLVPKALKAPHLIRRMIEEGHELGLHGVDHQLPFFKSRKELREKLVSGKKQLGEIAQRKIVLYRPSHGFKNLALVGAVRDAGLKFCFWDFGVWDTDVPAMSTLQARLTAVRDVAHETTILLLHDGLGESEGIPPHAPVLISVLKDFLPKILKTHLKKDPF